MFGVSHTAFLHRSSWEVDMTESKPREVERELTDEELEQVITVTSGSGVSFDCLLEARRSPSCRALQSSSMCPTSPD